MKIAFFTEMGFMGKVPKTHSNMRTEFAWMSTLNADHYNVFIDTPEDYYDLGIVINCKNSPGQINIDRLKKYCKEIGLMQEGPFWFFQDYTLSNQIHYYNNLQAADILFVHNEIDKKYYQGITPGKRVLILPSLMVEDPISIEQLSSPKERTGIMIGGNMRSWYGGFDSFIVAKSITDNIYSPKMGQRSEGEEKLGINQLPFLVWNKWIVELSKRKIGVHLMRTYAAGTFALNCAYLGIPCIGYDRLDTQSKCHPSTTVKLGEIFEARNLIRKLEEDKDFYNKCSQEAISNYKKYYHEDKFNTAWKEQFKIS